MLQDEHETSSIAELCLAFLCQRLCGAIIRAGDVGRWRHFYLSKGEDSLVKGIRKPAAGGLARGGAAEALHDL